MRVEDIERVVRTWQERLGLTDWRVEVRVERRFAFGDSVADILCHYDRSEATLRLCHPKDASYDDRGEFSSADLEASIVHELLHLRFEPLFRRDEPRSGSTEEHLLERAICRLERTLLEDLGGRLVTPYDFADWARSPVWRDGGWEDP